MPKLNQILEALNQLAPWDLADSWDQVGLQIGDPHRPVRKIMVSLDLSGQVIEEGIEHQVDGFVVHHPLIFKPVTQIHSNTPIGNYLSTLIKKDLFLVAAHTNVDKSENGLNQYLAELFGLEDIEPLVPATLSPQNYKVVVFCPEDYIVNVRTAMAEAGAGMIGEYTVCSFGQKGIGTFKPEVFAQPFSGKPNQFTEVAEIRLEMLAKQRNLSGIITAIFSKHPYEEPVVDVYPLISTCRHGLGRVGKLKMPVTFQNLCSIVKEKLAASEERVVGDAQKLIKRLAICSGSGGSIIGSVLQKEADAYITGDLSYHDFLLAKENNLAIIDAGHWTTEHSFITLVTDYLKHFFEVESDFKVYPSSTNQAEPYLTLK